MVKMYSKAKAPYLLPAQIKDPDLGVGDSTVEPTLGVGLVLAVAVTLCWPSPHLGVWHLSETRQNSGLLPGQDI